LKDPVCGMNVNEKSKFKVVYKNETYYFCSLICKEEFEKNPEKYLKK
jgi:YHS domain-containing protein